MGNLCALVISIIGSLFAVIVTLLIENYRLPKLRVSVENDARFHFYEGESWLFYKIKIENRSSFFSWLIVRQTAENCHANIEFHKSDGSLITMKGRWSSTPQMPEMPKEMWTLISNFPEPISIIAGKAEYLDILSQKESENNAYGFNNISYLHGWKYDGYKLPEGNHKIKVNIKTQNGVMQSFNLDLKISDNIKETSLSVVK